MTLIFNASPLIVLAKAGLLDRLIELADPAWVPQAVVDEILRVDDENDPARRWFERDAIPIQVRSTPPMSPFLAAWDLGAGESAVISLAAGYTDGAVAVLDDLAARRCAEAHGIPFTGTLGLVLLAKKRGLLGSVSRSLELIVAAGLHISPGIIAHCLAKAGE